MMLNIYLYKVVFVIELFVIEFLFMFHLRKYGFYYLRLAAALAASLLVAIALPVVSNAFYTAFLFLAVFAVTVAALRFCYREPMKNILFCCLAAYTAQHFAYQFADILISLVLWGKAPLFDVYSTGGVNLSGLNKETVFWIALYLVSYVSVYTLVYLIFCRQIKKDEDLKIRNEYFLIIIAAGLLINNLLNAIIVQRGGQQDTVVQIIMSLYNCFCCVLLLFMQFAFVHMKKLKTELAFINKLLTKEKEHYAAMRENMDLIDLKCHDIKYQIREIGRSSSISEKTIKEIESTVNIYDSFVKTGNDVLDVILTEKNNACIKNGISFDCMANVTRMGFMDDGDIFSLFGNILDNAIDAVVSIKDREKRVVSLKITSRGDFVSIIEKNYYEGEIIFDENGYPLTHKSRDYHGFGIKSIRYIVEKYGGDMSVKADEGVFQLSILFAPAAGQIAPAAGQTERVGQA